MTGDPPPDPGIPPAGSTTRLPPTWRLSSGDETFTVTDLGLQSGTHRLGLRADVLPSVVAAHELWRFAGERGLRTSMGTLVALPPGFQ